MEATVYFDWANRLAMLGWVALVFLPRRGRWGSWLLPTLSVGLVGLLALLYAVLICVYFFRIDGGGFGNLAQVMRLFTSPHIALAGWVHYLAFDLWVGIWIARQSDQLGWPRLLQAPLLLTTFMFGPIGWLLFQVARGVLRWSRPGSAAGKVAPHGSARTGLPV